MAAVEVHYLMVLATAEVEGWFRDLWRILHGCHFFFCSNPEFGHIICRYICRKPDKNWKQTPYTYSMFNTILEVQSVDLNGKNHLSVLTIKMSSSELLMGQYGTW